MTGRGQIRHAEEPSFRHCRGIESKLDDDTLTACNDHDGRGGKKQPGEFAGKAGTGMRLVVFKRVAPEKQQPPGADKPETAPPSRQTELKKETSPDSEPDARREKAVTSLSFDPTGLTLRPGQRQIASDCLGEGSHPRPSRAEGE
jgi:hypothetical protein